MDFKQDINGIDLALKVKQRDIQAKIIFITNYSNYATLTLKNKIEAVDYINKSQNIDILQDEIINNLVKSRLLCKMLYNVFTISTYQN
nr:response regulator [Enterococcus durans]